MAEGTSTGESEQIDVDEPDCEEPTQRVLEELDEAPPQEVELDPGDAAALEEYLTAEDLQPEHFAGGCLGPAGGAWGGASKPVDIAQAIGLRNGLKVTSRKRSSGRAGSDHHTSQGRSDAVDMSNGSRPTPAMDRTARQIAALLGVPNWGFGVLCRTCPTNGYRVQLLYRTNVGGNHFNHVHCGLRVGGRCR